MPGIFLMSFQHGKLLFICFVMGVQRNRNALKLFACFNIFDFVRCTVKSLSRAVNLAN